MRRHAFSAGLRTLFLLFLVMFFCTIFVLLHLFSRRLSVFFSFWVYGFFLRVLGIKLSVTGVPSQKSTLFVANHLSYLDILILGRILKARFISKAQVKRWPFIGWVAAGVGTLFVSRQRGSLLSELKKLSDHMRAKKRYILFAEGTSGNGVSLFPFKTAFFSLKEGGIQPVTLVLKSLNGLPVTASFKKMYAWRGELTLVEHLFCLMRLGNFHIELVFHPSVDAAQEEGRAPLTKKLWSCVAEPLQKAS